MVVILATVLAVLSQVQVPFEERDLGRVPADLIPTRTAFAPIGKVAAVFCRKGEDRYVWFRERTLGPFQGLALLVMNRDGSEVGFAANTGGVVDPKTGRVSGGKWAAYRGAQKVGPDVDVIGSFNFAFDNKDLAYIATDNGKSFVVVGDKIWPSFDHVTWLVATSDNPFALACDGGKADEKGIVRGGSWWLVSAKGDKNPGREGMGKPVIHSAAKAVAFVDFECGRAKGFQTLFWNKEAVAENARIWNPKFSEDGKTLVFAWGDDTGEAIVVARAEKEMTRWKKIGDFAIHPDGKRVAYVGKEKDAEAFAVFEGKQGQKFSEITTLTWSPDGKSLAYLGHDKLGNSWESCLVVGAEKTPFVSELSIPQWSPDSRKIAFGERDDHALRWRVLDVKIPEEPKLDWEKKVARTPKPPSPAETPPRPTPARAPKPAMPEIRLEKEPFRLVIPAGYVVAPVLPPKASFAYVRMIDEEKDLKLAISLELMGGTLGRDENVSDQDVARMVAKNLPPGAVVKRRKETWKNLEIDVLETCYTVGGVRLYTCGAQVPLMPEAIQIFVGGQEELRDVAQNELKKVLATVQGRSNWLTSDERQSAFWSGGLAVAGWLLFLAYGVCALTVFREEPTRAWQLRLGWLGGLSLCFALAFLWGLSYAESRGRSFTSFLVPVSSVACAALAARIFLRGRAAARLPAPASAPLAAATDVAWTSISEAPPLDRRRPAAAARPLGKPDRLPEARVLPAKRPMQPWLVLLLTWFVTGFAAGALFFALGGNSIEALERTMEGAMKFGLFLGIILYVMARLRVKRWEERQKMFETREKVAQKTAGLRCKFCNERILSTQQPWQNESFCSEKCRKAHAGG